MPTTTVRPRQSLLPLPEPDPGPDRWSVFIMDGPPEFRRLVWHESYCTTALKDKLAARAAREDLYFEAKLVPRREHY